MMNEPQAARETSLVEQYRVLLDVAESIISHRDLAKLFHDLAGHLHRVVNFDYINMVLHDPSENVMRLHLLETTHELSEPPASQLPVDQSPAGEVLQTQQPMMVSRVVDDPRYPYVSAMLKQYGVKSYCMLPLTSAGRRLGVLGLGSVVEAAYTESDLEFLQQVARQVAVALDNVLNFESAEASQRQLARERDRLRLLLEVNNAVVSHLDLRELFDAVSAGLRQVIPNELSSLALYDPQSGQMRVHALDFSAGTGLIREGALIDTAGTPGEVVLKTRKPLVLDHADPDEYPSEAARRFIAEGLQSGCLVPLISRDRVLGILSVASTRERAFTESDAELLTQIAGQVAIAVDNAMAYRQIEEFKNKLAEEKLYLEEEIQTEYNFEEIVGHSSALKQVLKQVETVAPTDSVVLIQGDTGTGKELIARAIHNLSGRRERTLVKVNCAAIPTGLLESELFGHERGAFTGAIAQRIGRFEIAHRGTIFLDEVGDIPLELQPKLLRVLQEQEFERLGSSRTIRVDVRVIAATNRDLAQMVANKEFRPDLYYRLNVFPISLPSLRGRPEDIPLLVRYFAQKYSRRMNKRIESIPSETMEVLVRYPWPGNIRELENLIERAAILTRGPHLEVPLAELESAAAAVPAAAALPAGSTLVPLEEMERQYIREVLRRTKGVIAGKGGAAEILDLPASTLRSRMKKLGLK